MIVRPVQSTGLFSFHRVSPFVCLFVCFCLSFFLSKSSLVYASVLCLCPKCTGQHMPANVYRIISLLLSMDIGILSIRPVQSTAF